MNMSRNAISCTWMRVALLWIPQEITDTVKKENDAMPVRIGLECSRKDQCYWNYCEFQIDQCVLI